MTPYDGLGLHDDEHIGPTGPKPTECGPEESVRPVQGWPRPFPFEHGKLLSEGEDLQGGIASIAKEGAAQLRIVRIDQHGTLYPTSAIRF